MTRPDGAPNAGRGQRGLVPGVVDDLVPEDV